MAYILAKKQPPSRNTGIFTVILDLDNPDPTTWATYADDAVGMTAGSDAWDTFFGHYPCILENGVELGKLKRSDFTKYEDGTSAPITTLGKDVMIAFPRRGWKIYYENANTLVVSITDEDNKAGYCYKGHTYRGNSVNKFYVSAYQTYIESNKQYSVSGKTPNNATVLYNARNAARARGTGYDEFSYYPMVFMQVMYLLKYKGKDAQKTIGQGRVNGSAYGANGYTNDKGMDWGDTSTNSLPMKLFGIENFYGNLYTIVDGIKKTAPETSGTLKVSSGDFAVDSSYVVIQNNYGYYQSKSYKKVIGTNEGGFLPYDDSAYGDYDTYFCDSRGGFAVDKVCGTGGSYNQMDGSAGVFLIDGYFNSFDSQNNSDASPRSAHRLMYFPIS